jgi:hypothetical protein
MRSLARFLFVAALLFTLVMAWLPHPPHVPWHEEDKIWHVLAFVTLSLLACLAFPAARLARIGERLSFLGAVIEVVQNLPVLHRDCDVYDWIAETIAIAVTLAIVAAIRRTRERALGAASPRPGA